MITLKAEVVHVLIGYHFNGLCVSVDGFSIVLPLTCYVLFGPVT